jgi:aminoglycoside phosphotransferase family enzyme
MSTTTDIPAGDDVELARKLAFLARPQSYPDAVERVSAVETRVSWVFLAGSFAYKLKKPIRLPYLDFRRVDARRRDCANEVRLNRRLAPGIYLGVVALTRDASGGLALGQDGPAVDWLVKMRRLPASGMLDCLIGRHAVPEPGLRELVLRLVRFYREAASVPWSPSFYVRRLIRDAEENAGELLIPDYALPAPRVRAILATQLHCLAEAAPRFEQRVRDGRVVEGHGDLRPEHICLEPGPYVIDCVEFKREFRQLDAVDELAFLAQECERLGDPEVGERILALYAACSGDTLDPALVSYYKSHRACLRAKIAAWHLRDPGVTDPGKWWKLANVYVDLAEKYAARCLGK